jgi:hypothetical protein
MMARRRGGRREPEAHLLTLILPIVLGIVGTVLYGYAGQNFFKTPSLIVLLAVFFLSLSGLATNTIMFVYIVESFPQWAGYGNPLKYHEWLS